MRKMSSNHTTSKPVEQYHYDKPLPLDKLAAIYARQSTTKQILENRESSAMQTTDLIARALREGYRDDGYILFIEGDGVRGVSGTRRIDQRAGLSALMEGVYADEIKVVFVNDVSRLFRDEFAIQVNTYIQACYEHDVLTITPSYRYDFRRHPYDVEQFRREAEQAANFIKNHIKRTVLAARDRVHLSGRYAGMSVPVGYVIDSTDRHNKVYTIYEPHAKVIRWIFRRFRELGGRVYDLGRELDRLPYVFPAVESGVQFKTKLPPKNGGYVISYSGLCGLLTNLKYIGWWTVGTMDEDGHRHNNDVQIVSRDNHPAIVDESDFWYAFNALSPTDIEGNQAEPSTRTVRYTQRENKDTQALLKYVVCGLNDRAAYAHYKGSAAVYSTMSTERVTYGNKTETTINVATIDPLFVERMMYRLDVFRNLQEQLVLLNSIDNLSDSPRAVRDALSPVLNQGMYAVYNQVQQQPISSLVSVDKQIAETHLAIKRAERDKQIASEEDYEQGVREAIRALRKLNSILEELEHKKTSSTTTAQDEAKCVGMIEEVRQRWDRMSLERQRMFISLAVGKLVLASPTAHWVRVEIHWKGPLAHTDVGYCRRAIGSGGEWSEEEEEVVRALYPSGDADEIMRQLPTRSWRAIKGHAATHGISRVSGQVLTDKRCTSLSLQDLAFMCEHGLTDVEGMQWLADACRDTKLKDVCQS